MLLDCDGHLLTSTRLVSTDRHCKVHLTHVINAAQPHAMQDHCILAGLHVQHLHQTPFTGAQIKSGPMWLSTAMLVNSE